MITIKHDGNHGVFITGDVLTDMLIAAAKYFRQLGDKCPVKLFPYDSLQLHIPFAVMVPTDLPGDEPTIVTVRKSHPDEIVSL